MAIFYTQQNNGVTAVVPEATYREMERRQALRVECCEKGLPGPQLPPVLPVFTFSDPDHHSFRFMTGSFALMRKLLVGHEVKGGNIWVPFSNGSETGIHGRDAQWAEFQFITNLNQAMEAFGLQPKIIIGLGSVDPLHSGAHG